MDITNMSQKDWVKSIQTADRISKELKETGILCKCSVYCTHDAQCGILMEVEDSTGAVLGLYGTGIHKEYKSMETDLLLLKCKIIKERGNVLKNSYVFKIVFAQDGYGSDACLCKVNLPKGISLEEMKNILDMEHNQLDWLSDNRPGHGPYDTQGRIPETLVSHMAEKYGWEIELLKIDAEIGLN